MKLKIFITQKINSSYFLSHHLYLHLYYYVLEEHIEQPASTQQNAERPTIEDEAKAGLAWQAEASHQHEGWSLKIKGKELTIKN